MNQERLPVCKAGILPTELYPQLDNALILNEQHSMCICMLTLKLDSYPSLSHCSLLFKAEISLWDTGKDKNINKFSQKF